MQFVSYQPREHHRVLCDLQDIVQEDPVAGMHVEGSLAHDFALVAAARDGPDEQVADVARYDRRQGAEGSREAADQGYVACCLDGQEIQGGEALGLGGVSGDDGDERKYERKRRGGNLRLLLEPNGRFRRVVLLGPCRGGGSRLRD